MTQYPRLETRRHKRRTSRALTITAVAAVVAIAAIGVWLGWKSISASRPAASAHANAGSRPATAATPSSMQSSTASSTPAASAAASATQADPNAQNTASLSDSATSKAAVRFPNAPAIGSTTRSVSELHPRHKYIALTLDDGYNFQPQLLDLLKQNDVRCTTFLIGSWAASHKADLKLMKDAGFEIANHSWSHPFLTRKSSAQVASELTRTQRVISSVTGNQAPYLRPPFGDTNSSVKATAAGLGYRIVMWDRTFGDSGRGATPQKLYDNVVNSNGGVKAGDVILCHWGSKPSYEALKRVLPDLKARGFEFVTISELIADSKPAK